MVQVDTSDYPKVKIYLDIRDKTTDEVPSGLKKDISVWKKKQEAVNLSVRPLQMQRSWIRKRH